MLTVGPVGTRPQWMRHCSSCFAHQMGLIPCKPAGWAGEGGWEWCKTRAGDQHRAILAFWLSAVGYFSMFSADPSVYPHGRKAGVGDAPGDEGWPNIRCCASSFGIKSGGVSPDCPGGAGAPDCHKAVTSGDPRLALLWPQCQVWENLHCL